MKTATVRDLKNDYKGLLRWVAAGEEVIITRKGVAVARLAPVVSVIPTSVNWKDSPEVQRNRSGESELTAEESAALIKEAGGQW